MREIRTPTEAEVTLLHGGQTGADRGAHEAAITNGWSISGYMPRDQRDEFGTIPPDVACFLVPHDKPGYAARTEANVRNARAVLIVVRDKAAPRESPGTAKTIDLAADRHLLRQVVDPSVDPAIIARWIWLQLRPRGTLALPGLEVDTHPLKLLVAGPRESKWPGARIETAALLRWVGIALAEIPRTAARDLAAVPR